MLSLTLDSCTVAGARTVAGVETTFVVAGAGAAALFAGEGARLERRRRAFVLRNFLRRRYRRGGDVLRRLEPADIVERIGKHHVERGRINLFRRNDPVVRFRGVVMFELPGRLRVIERRRVAGELELLHHLLGAPSLALEK